MLFCVSVQAQNTIDTLPHLQDTISTTDFYAYGKSPEKANDSLLQKLKTAANFKQKANAIIQLAQYHIQKGNIDSINYYGNLLYRESLQNTSTNIKNNYAGIATNFIAIAKSKAGLYDEALKWHLKGIEYTQQLKDSAQLYTHKLGMGKAYFYRKEYAKAQRIYNECLQHANTQNKENEIYRYLAALYLEQGNIKEAKQLYQKTLAFYQSVNDIKEQLKITSQLGVIAQKLNNEKEALAYFIEVKNQAYQHQFFDLYFNAQNSIGYLYFKSKQYGNAKIALNSAYINALQWNNLEAQKRILNNLKNVFVATKDYKNAYAIMTQYVEVSNTILKNQNKKEINELEIQYQTLQKENQIHILEKEQALKESEIARQKSLKIYLLIGFLVILIPVIALLYVYYQKLQTQSKLNKIQEEVNQQKVSTLLKTQELKLIKATVEGQYKERKRIAQELHDSIGGSLAAIKLQLSNAAKNNSSYTLLTKQIDETYHQVRDLSHNLIPKKFSESAFTTLLRQYIKNIQKENSVKITFSPHPEETVNSIPENIKIELYKIIQELLANAFKHAEATQIDIHINILNNTLKLLYEDNGKGFDTQKTHKGIGLANIKNRVQSLSGEIHIDSFVNRGTVIDIDIPINTLRHDL
jgi:signal transduction histidine kinase